jgi:hypothetical protein
VGAEAMCRGHAGVQHECFVCREAVDTGEQRAIGRDAWSMESTDHLERQWTLGEQIDGNSRRLHLAAASGPPGTRSEVAFWPFCNDLHVAEQACNMHIRSCLCCLAFETCEKSFLSRRQKGEWP